MKVYFIFLVVFISFETNFPYIFFFFCMFYGYTLFFEKIKHVNSVISSEYLFNIKFLKNLFILLLFLNLYSLVPYSFSFTSLPPFFFLSLVFWLSLFLPLLFYNMANNLAHFLPPSSPMFLSFFMVSIEVVSLLARPVALGIRLMANITASHLLIHLFCHSLESGFFYLFIVFILLLFLEFAVAFIQAYVFVMLLSLYTSEASS